MMLLPPESYAYREQPMYWVPSELLRVGRSAPLTLSSPSEFQIITCWLDTNPAWARPAPARTAPSNVATTSFFIIVIFLGPPAPPDRASVCALDLPAPMASTGTDT